MRSVDIIKLTPEMNLVPQNMLKNEVLHDFLG